MKKYIVGKPHRALAIFNMLLWLPLLFIITVFGLQEFKSPVSTFLFAIVFLLVDLLVTGPMVYSSGMWWSIDEIMFKYSSFRKFPNRIKAFYLPRQHGNYYLALKVEQMVKITLGWQDVPYPPFGLISHPITFTIEMIDGSTVELVALYTRESKKFVEACHYLEALGIVVNDHYGLLPVIDDPSQMVSRYIDDLERGFKND